MDIGNLLRQFFAPEPAAAPESPASPAAPGPPAGPSAPSAPGSPAAPAAPAAPPAPAQTDPAIEALDLAEPAKAGAAELKTKHPTIKFTSGRRSVHDQARAMASNVVQNRTWIEETYAAPAERAELQKWVDDHPEATTQDQIAVGLESVMSGWSDEQKGRLSKHFSGEAFDVQPVAQDADSIKSDIKALPGLTKFLEQEGGLVRWHAQF